MIINIIERNSTSDINNNPVELVKTNIKKKAEYIVFVEYITNIADVKTILEKKKKKKVSKFINILNNLIYIKKLYLKVIFITKKYS
jgi:hypothetical protein